LTANPRQQSDAYPEARRTNVSEENRRCCRCRALRTSRLPRRGGTENGLQTRRNWRLRSCRVNKSEVERPCGQWCDWSARPRWRTRAAISSGVRRSPARTAAAPGCWRPVGQHSRLLAFSSDRPEGRGFGCSLPCQPLRCGCLVPRSSWMPCIAGGVAPPQRLAFHSSGGGLFQAR
jgi:hypothetical protein